MNTARILQVLDEIAADMQRDVEAFEGAPFTGKTLGVIHGNLAAAVCGLVNVVKELVPKDQPTNERSI